MISFGQGPILGEKLRSFIDQGGSPEDAVKVANVLSAANTITDIMSVLPRSRMRVVPMTDGTWSLVDSRQTEVLAFRLTEAPQGATVEIVDPAR